MSVKLVGNGRRHYVLSDVAAAKKEVSILLIGAGGNGGPMITGLARMDSALKALGHAGIYLTVVDGDKIGPENVGRQLYSKSDIGRNKAECMVTRVNMFFGLRWAAHPGMIRREHIAQIRDSQYDIVVTAVDNVAAREIVQKGVNGRQKYFLDMGNSKQTGQVVLGTGDYIKQPPKLANTIGHLPTVLDLYPDLRKHEKRTDQGPSCSVAAALEKQDLFVNTAVTTFALDLLWKAFRKGYLDIHGVFINLETFKVTPLHINPAVWEQSGWRPFKTIKAA